ncbi:hypothetical protein STEG23_008949 [Scotinomys teguina]
MEAADIGSDTVCTNRKLRKASIQCLSVEGHQCDSGSGYIYWNAQYTSYTQVSILLLQLDGDVYGNSSLRYCLPRGRMTEQKKQRRTWSRMV